MLRRSGFGLVRRAFADKPIVKKTRAQIVIEKTPVGKIDQAVADEALGEYRHRDAEKQPLAKHPGGINPTTGEAGGPSGPEPTRFGDWERKGRVSDF